MKDYITRWAVGRLRSQLRKDEGYYIAWQSNIAMAFFDNYCWMFKKKKRLHSSSDIHDVSNKAATYFLDLFLSTKK